ncbi:hypothetical protein ACFPOE_17900 [Caenimonas terrae]|uniref:Uncharacterized protein n=1 Tax=Caenimonas terrae TaxID=696074 RepID=A0ABW0NGF5_9BURK
MNAMIDSPDPIDRQAAEQAIPALIGQVYECAPPAERGRMLEQLLQPLGVLSLVAIAHGIFAGIRLRSGARDFHIRLDEVTRVQASDVVALAQHVQQVSVEAVDNLAQLLSASPSLAASAATALLVAMLVKRRRARQAHTAMQDDEDPAPVAPRDRP